MMKYHLIIIFILCLSISLNNSCSKEDTIIHQPPEETPALYTAFSKTEIMVNIRSLVVFKDAKLVKQTFYADADQFEPQDVRTVAQSIISLLIGIAIDKGYIKSVEQTLNDFTIPLPDPIPPNIAEIKLKDLLTMSSGFEWEELTSAYTYNRWIASGHQAQYLFNKPFSAEPGKEFNYNSGAFHLLSIVLTSATKMKALDFANEFLFFPLGINCTKWEPDRQGFSNGSGGLYLSPYDMIKIGQLIINGGEYAGKRIVSEKWINESMTPKIQTNNAIEFGSEYGYGWWINRDPFKSFIFANGYGGQFIVIVPSSKLVIAATNKWNGVKFSMINDQWIRTLKIIAIDIIPAFK